MEGEATERSIRLIIFRWTLCKPYAKLSICEEAVFRHKAWAYLLFNVE